MSNASMIGLANRGAVADWAGMVASIGCAIHCAAMPLVLAYLPSLGLGWLADEGFHRWMAVICFALAAAAFVPGWRKHRSFLPAIWGGIGLLLLTTAAFGMEESCCASCATCEHVTSAAETNIEGTSTTASSLSFAWITPFVTPLGGLLLVLGHVVNHNKSCRCQGQSCCLSDEEPRR